MVDNRTTGSDMAFPKKGILKTSSGSITTTSQSESRRWKKGRGNNLGALMKNYYVEKAIKENDEEGYASDMQMIEPGKEAKLSFGI
jgi:hypothetical protein